MPAYFPPTTVFPNAIDSDHTLYLVYNTTESMITENNSPWSDEIPIKPVPSFKDEVWPDNGFATISGELLYYNSVEKNASGKVKKLKGCARNLSGVKTKYNLAGTDIRGFVIAEHHNQLVDAVLSIEEFLGGTCTSTDTLECCITELEINECEEDSTCPAVSFDYQIQNEDNCVGTSIAYQIEIAGNFNRFRLDFGDGTFTTIPEDGTKVFAPGAVIDPVLIVSNELCEIVLSGVNREDPSEIETTPPPEQLTIPIPIIDIPEFVFPSFDSPSTDISIPPLITPCFDLDPIDISIGPISIGDISVPSIISIIPPIFPPISITGPTFSNISIIGPILPSVISIIPPQIPSVISIIPPNIPPISIIPPSIPPISIIPPNIPPISIIPPSIPPISIIPPNIPSIINFGPVNIPSIINFGPVNIPSIINFGPVNIPSIINFGPVDIPSIINFGPVDIPSIINFGPVYIPSIINFGPVYIPSIINFGPVYIPSIINFGPVYIPSIISFGIVEVPSIISFSPVYIPNVISVVDNIPTEISLNINIPSVINVIDDIPSVISVIDTIPNIISFNQLVPSYISVIDDIPSVISLINDNIQNISLIVPQIDAISVNWGTPPTVSCTISLGCPSASPSQLFFRPADMADDPDDFDALPTANIEVDYDFVGIPSRIIIEPPNIPAIEINASAIPQEILLLAPDIPSKIIVEGMYDMPSTIKLEIPKAMPVISIDTSTLPESIPITWGVDTPREIKIVGHDIPSIINVQHDIPSVITVEGMVNVISVEGFPEFIGISIINTDDLVVTVDPIEVKITIDTDKLITKDGEGQHCFALVPCKN